MDRDRTEYLGNRLVVNVHDPLFSAMLTRRGYTVILLSDNSACQIMRGEAVIIDYLSIEHVTMLEVERMLDEYLGYGQHHMQCRCGESVLRSQGAIFIDHFEQVPLLGSSFPFSATEQEHYYLYRAVSAGPRSNPITVCLCGRILNTSSVQEIAD